MLDFKEVIAKSISACIDGDLEEIKGFIEVPPSKNMGDYAFPCFRLAKIMKKSPQEIARELKEKMVIDEAFISNVEIKGGYLNFFVNQDCLIRNVLARN